MAKLHVVGGGPAGSIAAISALRSGHDVVVSEEHPVSGIPENCSGLFSVDGLESLSSYMSWQKLAIAPIRGAHIHMPGQSFTVRRKEPVGYLCDRAAMDQELAARAQNEGAEYRYGERVDGDFRSKNIIGADGPLSSVALRFKFPAIRRFASTLQANVPYKSEEPDMVEVFLSNSLFPGFFGWIIPHDDRNAEFGVGVEMPGHVGGAWRALLRQKGMPTDVKPRGAIIPLRMRGISAMRKDGYNVLLAGDAAGQVKATTGGGVIFGGNCAALAGRFATDPLRYEMEWKARFGPDLAMHAAIRRFFSGATDRSLSSLGRTFKKLNIDAYLSGHGHMDRPTRMLRPQLLAHIFRNVIG
ncbi:MAG: NAD(P)/FAD-dependent oxidoreductase [Candidatus Micrarchaeota archaeon]